MRYRVEFAGGKIARSCGIRPMVVAPTTRATVDHDLVRTSLAQAIARVVRPHLVSPTFHVLVHLRPGLDDGSGVVRLGDAEMHAPPTVAEFTVHRLREDER